MNLALIRYSEAPRRILGYCASAILRMGWGSLNPGGPEATRV